MALDDASVEYVDAWRLRDIYEDQRIDERVAAGELYELVTASAPASPASGQPEGTVSELVAVFSPVRKVAEVHRFILRDGTLGASGYPDPKMIVVDQTVYLLASRLS